MRRLITAIGATVLIAGLVPATALAAIPTDQYQVISARNADAGFSRLDGCIQTTVWVSSSSAIFGGRPGPVTKQGLTSVSLTMEDTCQPMVGKHFPVVFDGFAQTFDPLVSNPRMSAARIDLALRLDDAVSGQSFDATVHLRWSLVGAMSHDPSHINFRVAGDGVIASHDNDWHGDAVAAGTLSIDGETLTLASSESAHLELIKAHCQKIALPHASIDEISCIVGG